MIQAKRFIRQGSPRWGVETSSPRRRLLLPPDQNTREDAIAWRDRLIKDGLRPDKITLKALGRQWLHEKQHLRKQTLSSYRGSLAYLDDYFGGLEVAKIDRRAVLGLKDHLSGLSLKNRTRNGILAVLAQVLHLAVLDGVLRVNWGREVQRFPASKAEMEWLEPGEVRDVLGAAQALSSEYHTLLLLAVSSGMRRGELLALEWSDLDFEERTAAISKTWTGGELLDKASSKGGFRRIDLGKATCKALLAHRLISGNPKAGFVFGGQEPLDEDLVGRRLWRKVLKAAGVKPVRFHDLRHTYASIMFAKGADPKYIQHQLGHSSITITMDVYTHFIKSAPSNEADRMDEAIAGG